MIKKISTEKAPAAIGPYSQAMVWNEIIFTSGQIPIQPETGEIVGSTIEEQGECVMNNVKAVLEAGSSDLEHVIKTTCYLANMEDFAVFNRIYAKYFIGNPARSCVAVKTLPKNVLCEVEVIAIMKK